MDQSAETASKESSEEVEQDIDVVNESDSDVLTYSTETIVKLYNYENGKYSPLMVPYSTIKLAKKAREQGIRQVTYELFSRPDKSSHLRSMLDLWGFRSYVNYLYTVCELGFLEGLIPVVDFGFLSPDELKELHDVVALFKVPLFSEYDFVMNKDGIRDEQHSANVRLKSFEWVNKLGYSNITGFFAYGGQTKTQWGKWLDVIAEYANKFNAIHEVNITTVPRMTGYKIKRIDVKQMKDIYKLAKDRLPENVSITFPNAPVEMQKFLIDQEENDLSVVVNTTSGEDLEAVIEDVKAYSKKNGKRLLKRFALRKEFIHHEKYSKKLGQVFDSYKYKIKKQIQEKLKEAKQ